MAVATLPLWVGRSPLLTEAESSLTTRCRLAEALNFGSFDGRGRIGAVAPGVFIHVLGWLPKNRVLVVLALAKSPAVPAMGWSSVMVAQYRPIVL